MDEIRQAAQFRLALSRFLGSSDTAVRKANLTPQRYLLLLAIKGSPGERLTITDLADMLQSAQSTVTELVDRCEKAGLVIRGGANDGRVVVVSLTPNGEAAFRRAFSNVRGEREQLMAYLSDTLD